MRCVMRHPTPIMGAPDPAGPGEPRAGYACMEVERMKDAGELERENAALRDRLSRLSQASLRINERLDFEGVLQEVVDSARAITDARFGGLTTVDGSGQLESFLSSGLTPEQHEALYTPEGPAIYDLFLNMKEPLRVDDLTAYVKSLGYPGNSAYLKSFLGTPILHRGVPVGLCCVANKEGGGGFTQEDEATLVMFASQAALVIANARRHRDERRARTDLETLVNTTPVGVLVFDAKTGGVTSVNPEARRIVNDLCAPGGSAEQLLEVLTFRRFDGRDVSLEEFPLALALSTGETVRAEEIVLQGPPTGRSVTTLINATPIFSEEGEVESVVVTLQDMTPMEELERLRAEFLGMVSHELRTPLAAVKGSVDTLLESASDLDSAEMTQFFRIIRDQSENMRYLIGDLLDVARIETGTLPVSPEPVEAGVLVDEARSRFQSGGGRSNLVIDLPPDLPRVMADRRRIVQALGNLLSNAAHHSNELSPIRVAAVRDGVHVAFSVADDGVGVPAERLPHLFRKFSRLDGEERGREIAGSGLGLAICKGIVEGPRWAASGPRATGRAWEAGSPSPFRRWRRPSPFPLHGHAGAGRKTAERPRILCVDDDPQTLRYVRDALTKAGYTPVVTGDPEEVSRLMAEEAPRLVLLDMMLPGRDGMELMKDIREVSDVPVIFLSVNGQEEVVARALRHGSGRLRGQALLADGACGQDQGGPAQAAQARGAGAGPALRALRAGSPDHRLCPAQGDGGRPPGRAHLHRVPDAGRAFGQRGAGADPRAPAATGLGTGQGRRHRAGEEHRQEAAQQAGRGRVQPGLHLRRAQGRLPDGEGGGAGGCVDRAERGNGATVFPLCGPQPCHAIIVKPRLGSGLW